jgi:hypothetical protein
LRDDSSPDETLESSTDSDDETLSKRKRAKPENKLPIAPPPISKRTRPRGTSATVKGKKIVSTRTNDKVSEAMRLHRKELSDLYTALRKHLGLGPKTSRRDVLATMLVKLDADYGGESKVYDTTVSIKQSKEQRCRRSSPDYNDKIAMYCRGRRNVEAELMHLLGKRLNMEHAQRKAILRRALTL